MTQLPNILKEEENEAYRNEISVRDDSFDILTKQHNVAVRTIAVGHIVEKVILCLLTVP